jgi:predicted DNA-binding WGR domain protein
MARRKGTSERSRLVRGMTPAFSRRQRGGDPPEETPTDEPASSPDPGSSRTSHEKPLAATQPIATRPDPSELSDITPPEPGGPDSLLPTIAASELVRRRTSTVAMPLAADLGRPPEMPTTVAPPPLVLGDVENPTHLPSPRQIPAGAPDDPAPAPGRVPPGDSRSLRRDDEFALVYRVGTCVITRTGRLGTRGQWRVVEYPTSAAASNCYAKECSRFVSDGFSDYRD